MALKYLLDSVVLIDQFNGIADATEFLRSSQGHAAISAITRAEVMTGFDAEAAPLAARLLNAFRCLAIDKDTADKAALLRRANLWKLPAAIQAALAQSQGLLLVTRNTKDFPASLDFVLTPYRIQPHRLA